MRPGTRVLWVSLLLLIGFSGISSAAVVTDPTGDAIGPTDITAIQAEQMIRPDGIEVLKVSYTATPNIGGIVVFEANVDNNTETGGTLSMTGIPVAPCPCKTTPGIDVAIIAINRDQDASSNSAICAGCSDSTAASCARMRRCGEYFAVASGLGTTDTVGVLRGFSDPPAVYDRTYWNYTFPWSFILTYVNEGVKGTADEFDYADAIDPATTRWQLSVWTDAAYAPGNQDDFGDGSAFFNISDWAPNGDAALVPAVDIATRFTFCEGNMDNDPDQDGQDASIFKTDFGRNPVSFKCPSSGPNY